MLLGPVVDNVLLCKVDESFASNTRMVQRETILSLPGGLKQPQRPYGMPCPDAAA